LAAGSIHHHHELPHVELNLFHRSPSLIGQRSIAASLGIEFGSSFGLGAGPAGKDAPASVPAPDLLPL
jgi:hypothetical protein